ncbi:DNA polymerase III subunit gamma/tau [Gossypium australe]|uniref:DNA polymerase III subunit gamma/tau n=1 Tax=Gossypium australe TaxID=47621 RepID=A0A5B6UDV4_9ROSI|nr:DNA polymerase III subunit gamma/tau [Gossypium australe]
MTRVIGDRILKDANGDINGHLRNHIHLTNCIHLKNHMHKHSPMLADRSLMRDLMVLRRSRSLRDPSASPQSWQSPPVVDLVSKNDDDEGIERQRDEKMLSVSSPPLVNFANSKVVPVEVNEGEPAISDHSGKTGTRDSRKIRREEASRRSSRVDLYGENKEPEGFTSGNSGRKDRKSRKQKGKQTQGVRLKTLSEKLNYPPLDGDDVASSNIHLRRRHFRPEKPSVEPEVSIRGRSSGLSRVKRRKFRGARRACTASSSREMGGPNELSVASNSFAQGSVYPKYGAEEEEEENEYDERNVTQTPNCGIPFNWSRIHHRGKSFLDIAGRRFSCGLSDTKLRKGGAGPNGRNVTGMPVESDQSSSSAKPNAEVLPLLVEASGSQDSAANAGWSNDYSGELGIFADNLLKRNVDSDLASEAGYGDKRKLSRNLHGRHQNLTQKYMPRTFRDLVGQNLVSQALSNAVVRRKVGLLYIFYGPHGTGKTSCARIFARALNCQSLEQPKPCGFCNSCISHDKGKSQNIREVGPVGNFDFEGIMDQLDNMTITRLPSQYRVFIFDDCDSLSTDCWSAISKVIDRVPRRIVFIFVSSSLDILPHIIMSRCQKFFFPKLKDADIIYALQRIASREDIEIEKDALKLIASLSDGSLRDAEMTLEQLSLLGQRISVPLVQELVGLISDEKLVDLLDLALSADTVNTIKSLRVIMETVYNPVSKEDMEKLRQALKTLSEAEKQLRMSNEKLTWLTAALLQLAPDQQYILPISSSGTSSHHSPLPLNDLGGREIVRKGGELVELRNNNTRVLSTNARPENIYAGSSGDFETSIMKGKRHALAGMAPQSVAENRNGTEGIWLEVLQKIQDDSLKEFLYREGKLISVNLGAAPTVRLTFSSQVTKSKAEKFRGHILQAFESVLGSPVTIEIRCEAKKDVYHGLLDIPPSGDGPSQIVMDPESNSRNRMPSASLGDISKRPMRNRDAGVSPQAQLLHHESLEAGRSEIVVIPASLRKAKDNEHASNVESNQRDSRVANAAAYRKSTLASTSGRPKAGELSQSHSIVRSKVSLAHVIQHAEGCKQRNEWSKHNAMSIAEQLEKENLRLEPRSRSLLCWKASRVTPLSIEDSDTKTTFNIEACIVWKMSLFKTFKTLMLSSLLPSSIRPWLITDLISALNGTYPSVHETCIQLSFSTYLL